MHGSCVLLGVVWGVLGGIFPFDDYPVVGVVDYVWVGFCVEVFVGCSGDL